MKIKDLTKRIDKAINLCMEQLKTIDEEGLKHVQGSIEALEAMMDYIEDERNKKRKELTGNE